MSACSFYQCGWYIWCALFMLFVTATEGHAANHYLREQQVHPYIDLCVFCLTKSYSISCCVTAEGEAL